MRRCDFQIDGLTEKHLRRLKRLTEPASMLTDVPNFSVTTLKILTSFAVTTAVLYAIEPFTPRAIVEGEIVRAKKVLVMKDRSGSMGGKEKQLAALIALFEGSDMEVVKDSARGFGVSTEGAPDNLLHELESSLKENPDVDAVYVFSDFPSENEPAVDGDNPAGYQRLRELLGTYQVRLYLDTVEFSPLKEMIEIAVASGGGMVKNSVK